MAYTSNREGEELILSRLADLQVRAQGQGRPCAMGFLDDFQQKLCKDALNHSPLFWRFFGGDEEAERVFLCVCPWEEIPDSAFPLCCVEMTYREQDLLEHRDFLGAILGLGVKREAVGDIVVMPGKARVYLAGSIKGLVLGELDKVGRVGVICQEGPLGQERKSKGFEEMTGSISSLRLDCVVSFLTNCSRTGAADLINSGTVAIDGQTATSLIRQVRQGEKISIRGSGKFIYDGALGLSKKNKERVQFRKYR